MIFAVLEDWYNYIILTHSSELVSFFKNIYYSKVGLPGNLQSFFTGCRYVTGYRYSSRLLLLSCNGARLVQPSGIFTLLKQLETYLFILAVGGAPGGVASSSSAVVAARSRRGVGTWRPYWSPAAAHPSQPISRLRAGWSVCRSTCQRWW